MAKRAQAVGNMRASRSPKTKKRLAIKKERLATLAEKRAKHAKKKNTKKK